MSVLGRILGIVVLVRGFLLKRGGGESDIRCFVLKAESWRRGRAHRLTVPGIWRGPGVSTHYGRQSDQALQCASVPNKRAKLKNGIFAPFIKSLYIESSRAIMKSWCQEILSTPPMCALRSRCCADTRKLYKEKRVPVSWILPVPK